MPRTRALELSDLGLAQGHSYEAYGALNADKPVAIQAGRLVIAHQPPHSVRLIKIIDTSVPAAAPSVTADVPKPAQAGEVIHLRAADGVPTFSYHWDFGGGTTASGEAVSHTFTRAADYNVKLTVDGVDGIPAEKSFTIAVQGTLKTAFHLLENRRYVEWGSKYFKGNRRGAESSRRVGRVLSACILSHAFGDGAD